MRSIECELTVNPSQSHQRGPATGKYRFRSPLMQSRAQTVLLGNKNSTVQSRFVRAATRHSVHKSGVRRRPDTLFSGSIMKVFATLLSLRRDKCNYLSLGARTGSPWLTRMSPGHVVDFGGRDSAPLSPTLVQARRRSIKRLVASLFERPTPDNRLGTCAASTAMAANALRQHVIIEIAEYR